MRVTRLRLHGFKSFVDSVDIPIQPGITGIVGPNGCGKSNLVEALRFVMGESSYKAMRGGGIHVRLASASKLFAAPDTLPGAPPTGLSGFAFKFALTLNGSSELTFAPVAQQTTVALNSDWSDPGFTGAFLPNDRNVEANAFSARWQSRATSSGPAGSRPAAGVPITEASWSGRTPISGKSGLPGTDVKWNNTPIACSTPARPSRRSHSSSRTVLKLKSLAPFWATMKSAPPVWMISPDVCSIPPVTAPSATTVEIPTAMPTTVSSVRVRCRKRLRTINATNDIPRHRRSPSTSVASGNSTTDVRGSPRDAGRSDAFSFPETLVTAHFKDL